MLVSKGPGASGGPSEEMHEKRARVKGQPMTILRTSWWAMPVVCCWAVGLMTARADAAGAAASEEQLLAGAAGRIEKHRKGDAVIRVLAADGKPAAGVKVQVRQTRHAFLFGSNIFYFAHSQRSDPRLLQAYLEQYTGLLNFATLPFYWPAYEPQRGKPMHEQMAKVAQWCKAKGITTKGHPLAWNYSDAKWFPSDADELRGLQMARIEDCVGRFRGLIDIWDVVNEATHFDRAEMASTRSPKHTGMWKKAGQVEFTRECFAHARRAGVKATLLINDYRTDPAYEKLIRQLVDDRGKRIYDVIGIQSHMHGGAWPTRKIWDVCERYAAFRVPLHFTEVTILSGKRTWQGERGKWPSTPEGEKYQAEHVARFYTMLFSHPAVEAITWWDFSDARAWKGAPAGFLRKDMTPKPAYHALRKLVKETWWTTASVTTDAAGKAAVRGFLGDYEVTAVVGGKEIRRRVVLAKGRDSQWELRP